MFKVRVPASTANLGPGFDCMGIALKLYSTAEFEKIDSGFEIVILDESRAFVPTDRTNLVYRAIEAVYASAGKDVPDGIKVTVSSDIPVTKGLGSSSSGIVLGVVGANHMLGNIFSAEELIYIASELEGHPDNVTPALAGGFTVSMYESGKIVYSKSPVDIRLRFGAMIPDFFLQTKKSRRYLPRSVSMRSACYNVAHASMLAAAMSTANTDLLSYCFKDRLHQRYRFPHIRSGEYIIRAAKRYGALGGYISGAGPTIMTIVDKDYEAFEYNMNELIKTNLKNWRLVMLEADNNGAVIE